MLRAIDVQGYPYDITFTSDGEKIGICRLPDFDKISNEAKTNLMNLLDIIKKRVPSIQYGNVCGRTTLYIKEKDKDCIQSILNLILSKGYRVTPIDHSLITLEPGDKFDAFHSLSRLLKLIKERYVPHQDGYRLFRVVSLLPIQNESFWEGLRSDPSLYNEALKIASDAYQVLGEESQSF
jgi:hypothetical protein